MRRSIFLAKQASCLAWCLIVSKAASRKLWLFTRGVAKAYCLDKLASSQQTFVSVQPLAEAYLAHCTAHAEEKARV